MCKSEIFAEILNIVGKETEVSTELILSSSKVTEVVDARSIVVFFLTEYGLYPGQMHQSNRLQKSYRGNDPNDL